MKKHESNFSFLDLALFRYWVGCKDEQKIMITWFTLYFDSVCIHLYILVCTGGTCDGGYEFTCSTNGACVCFQTSDGKGLCDTGTTPCNTLPDCSNCLTATHACMINTCCDGPKCTPRTNDCPPRAMRQAANLFRSNVLKRVQCNEDEDCDFGKSCKWRSRRTCS